MEENKIIIYQTEDGQTQIDVRLENDTVWLNDCSTLSPRTAAHCLNPRQFRGEHPELGGATLSARKAV